MQTADAEKRKRVEASIREREKVVQKMKEEEMRALDRERGQYKKEEAMQHFKALLSDLVSWKIFYFCVHFKRPFFWESTLKYFH